mmetsp:Transcript_20289/g.58664  ORF Transcript_20289/g.58664 Transcript_20289/m.58664 type:complete len:386 (+) Transcript_20289:1451-2608(+)
MRFLEVFEIRLLRLPLTTVVRERLFLLREAGGLPLELCPYLFDCRFVGVEVRLDFGSQLLLRGEEGAQVGDLLCNHVQSPLALIPVFFHFTRLLRDSRLKLLSLLGHKSLVALNVFHVDGKPLRLRSQALRRQFEFFLNLLSIVLLEFLLLQLKLPQPFLQIDEAPRHTLDHFFPLPIHFLQGPPYVFQYVFLLLPFRDMFINHRPKTVGQLEVLRLDRLALLSLCHLGLPRREPVLSFRRGPLLQQRRLVTPQLRHPINRLPALVGEIGEHLHEYLLRRLGALRLLLRKAALPLLLLRLGLSSHLTLGGERPLTLSLGGRSLLPFASLAVSLGLRQGPAGGGVVSCRQHGRAFGGSGGAVRGPRGMTTLADFIVPRAMCPGRPA